jgi:flavin-binding protein dodecin
MAIARVTEIIASSGKSFEDAVESVVIKNNKVVEYRVNLMVTFVLED